MKYTEYQYSKTVKVPKLAYGVEITPIWDCDEDGEPLESVGDIECQIVKITPEAIKVVGNEPCLDLGNNYYIPVSLFQEYQECQYGDTHDLRCFMFDTKKQAREHLDYTLNRFHNPQPWESFIKLS